MPTLLRNVLVFLAYSSQLTRLSKQNDTAVRFPLKVSPFMFTHHGSDNPIIGSYAKGTSFVLSDINVIFQES